MRVALGLPLALDAKKRDRRPQSAPELISNTAFDSDTGWTLQAGWTVSGGTLNANLAASAFASTPITLVAGRSYRVIYTITAFTSGLVRARLSGGTDVLGTDRSAVGTYTETMTAVSGNNVFNIQARNAGFVGSIDNVSVKEII